MSLNYQAIEELLYDSLTTYLTSELGQSCQIIFKDQVIPVENLQLPRISLKLSEPYNTENVNPQEIREVVTSTDPEFDNDILHTFKFAPKLNLSVNGFGTTKREIRPYIDKVRDFFMVQKLGSYVLETLYNGVIKTVGDTKDRTTILEQEYQKRLGFDITLEFEDNIEVRNETIETIEINYNNNIIDNGGA